MHRDEVRSAQRFRSDVEIIRQVHGQEDGIGTALPCYRICLPHEMVDISRHHLGHHPGHHPGHREWAPFHR